MKRTLFAALAFVMMVGVAIVLPLSSAHALSTFVAETETKIYIAGEELRRVFHAGQQYRRRDALDNGHDGDTSSTSGMPCPR